MSKSRSVSTYLIAGVLFLLVLLIAAKWFYNYQSNKYAWTAEDRQRLIEECIMKTEGYAVRFPFITEEYCSCSTDSIIAHFTKAEYLQIEQMSFDEQGKHLLPVIKNCFNTYQNKIFEESPMPD